MKTTALKLNRRAWVTWVTLVEACSIWGVHRNSIIWAYWSTRVLMRKSAGTWMVYVPDMDHEFGTDHPPIELEPEEQPKNLDEFA